MRRFDSIIFVAENASLTNEKQLNCCIFDTWAAVTAIVLTQAGEAPETLAVIVATSLSG
jgi:hypothetical protein